MESTYRRILETERPEYEPVIVNSPLQVTKALILEKKIDGFMCCDDAEAIRVAGRLRSEGIAVPGDIAIVGYGNSDLARYVTPGITSVDCHAQEMAQKMFEILSAGLSGQDIRLSQYVIQPELVIRET